MIVAKRRGVNFLFERNDCSKSNTATSGCRNFLWFVIRKSFESNGF